MKRFVVLIVLAAGLLVLGFGAWVLVRPPDPDVCRERYGRIAVGMTEAEVQEILDESLRGYPFDRVGSALQLQLNRSHHSVAWFSHAGGIAIGFDEAGRVVEKSRNRAQYPGALERVEGLVTGAGTSWLQEEQHSAENGSWTAVHH